MKRNLLTIPICCILAVALAFGLVSCGDDKDNKETQNTESTESGETDKKSECELNGHTFKNATCTAPKTCSVCGATEGESKEHTGGTATCGAKAACESCGTAYGELDPDNHIVIDESCACGEIWVIDATEMTAEQLNAAVAEKLAAGKTDIEILLAPDAPVEMITAIRRAICDTEGVKDGTVHLTLTGVTSITDDTDYEGIAFGERDIYDENEYFIGVENVTQLTSVDLPDVLTIGDYAFSYCENLTAVTAPKVQTIGQWAFAYTALTSVEFPEATTNGSCAFIACQSLTSVKLPKATGIDHQAFLGSKNITYLELTAEGNITLGTDVFGIPSQNFSDKVDLLLHSNKLGEVDGLTWNGYTFRSIEFLCADGTTNHTYGAAVNNGDATHTSTCTTCNLTKNERCYGEATCKELATCEVCCVQFGELSDHILDGATGYCKFGCETWMATFKIEAPDSTTYHKDIGKFQNEVLADGSVVTLFSNASFFGWGITGDYTLDMNGYDLTGDYSFYSFGTSEKGIVNSAYKRSTVASMRIDNGMLKIGSNVDVKMMILFYPSCTVDLTNADFVTCELKLDHDSCNTSQFVLGNYAIYDAKGNVVTGELIKGVTYTIKAAQ